MKKMVELYDIGYEDENDLLLKEEISSAIFGNANHLNPLKTNLLDRFALVAFQEMLRAKLQQCEGPENLSDDDIYGMPCAYTIAGRIMAERRGALERAKQICCGALEQEQEELVEAVSELCSEAEEESPAEQAN